MAAARNERVVVSVCWFDSYHITLRRKSTTDVFNSGKRSLWFPIGTRPPSKVKPRGPEQKNSKYDLRMTVRKRMGRGCRWHIPNNVDECSTMSATQAGITFEVPLPSALFSETASGEDKNSSLSVKRSSSPKLPQSIVSREPSNPLLRPSGNY